jgi:predicted permease
MRTAFSNAMQDVRYALRQMRRSPGFALTAVLTLGLGVGVTAAVYSVIQTVLLEPLPYPEAERLVGAAWTFPHEKPNAEQAGTSADFVRDHARSFSSTAVLDDGAQMVNLAMQGPGGGGRAVQIAALRVSQGYFRTLGMAPALGREFLAEEDRPSGAKVVVLSDGLWQSLFNRDPGAVGQTIRVNEESFTVVGVMPAGFRVTAETAPGVTGTPDLWQPLQLSEKDPGYDGDNYSMIARLKPGVTLEQAQAELSLLNEPFYQKYPKDRNWVAEDRSPHEFRVWKLQDVLVSNVRRSLWTLMGAVIAVLLVACLNLAGLMTARAMRRSKEIALRSALGATKGQLTRLVMCEGLLLALGGAALAMLVATGSARLLLHSSPIGIPALHRTDAWTMAGVVLAISLAAGGVVSVLPAWVTLRRRTREMRLGGNALGETLSHARLSRGLLSLQIALAMVLVATASSLLGTFIKLQSLPSGVEPKQLTVFQVTLKGGRYAGTRPTTQFVDTVLDRLRSSPGVLSASAVNGLPLDRGLNMGAYPAGRPELGQTIEFRAIAPEYFHTMGIPVLSGRDIGLRDTEQSEPVILVGAAAAKKWWPGRSPIGETIRIGKEKYWRIVGVVADVKQNSLVESQGVVVYGPMAQLSDEFTAILNGWFATSFAIRTSAHVSLAEAVQRAVAAADPEIPVARLTTMQAVIDGTIASPRFFSLLAGGFSGFAVLLTVIGLFGLLSYQVTQRTREIGVRMALGAGRFTILRSILARGLAVASVGIVLGAAASWLLRQVVADLLADAGVSAEAGSGRMGFSAVETLLVAAGAILCATFVASWLPARRASGIEPMQALRTE